MDANPVLETKWDFGYDGDGVRTATLTTPYDETGNPQSATLTSYYFGGAYEVTGTDAKKYYSFGGQTVMRDADGLQYFLADHLGSVVAITDEDGTLTSQQRYLPFGGVRSDITTPNAPNSDFGYTGQRLLDSGMGGLMDYKARFYSPLLGRFTQPDSLIPNPINPQAWNRFSYVVNRPINLNDPTGHCFSGAVVDTIACVTVLAGVFFVFNGTSDSYQPNLPAEELQARETSTNLGVALIVSGHSVKAPIVEALSNLYDCATGVYCGPESFAIPGSTRAYNNVNVTNPYPNSSKLVRLVPEDIAEKIAYGNHNITLSHPRYKDTFVSAAEDLANYRTQSSVAKRLALPTVSRTERNALVVFNYDFKLGEIASPVNRTFAEFTGMGRTAGGAREWVIPNRPIKDLPIRNIYVRRLR